MSTNPRIYLDYNATMPMVSATREAMRSVLDQGLGNPSSIHADGRRARDVVERARDQVARLLSRPREQVIFTSGGTEANAIGVLGLAAVVEKRGGPRIVASAPIDHPSLIGVVHALVARGWTHRPIAVDCAGRLGTIDTDTRREDRIGVLDGVGVVALSAVNHELGTVLDLRTWMVMARATGALVHVDAVQLAGKRPIEIDAHSIAISAHKIGGPQGIGALAISIDDGLPVIESGHQERERRGGTENTIGIAGFGAAAAAIDVDAWPRVVELGARLEKGLIELGARINGVGDVIAPPGKSLGHTVAVKDNLAAHESGADAGETSPGAAIVAVEGERIGGTINAAFAGVRGESIVIALDLAGISVSTGAACTSGSIQPSKVLLALGQSPEQAREAVRFSLGTPTTERDIDTVLAALPTILARARR